MNLKNLAFITCFAAASFLVSSIALSQPSEDGKPRPGFWQPEVAVDNTRDITLKLVNESGINLEYGEAGISVNPLPPSSSRDIKISIVQGRKGDIASIPINAENGLPLSFLYKIDDKDKNLVTVQIRLSSSLQEEDKAVYIDEKGRVYSF